MRRQGWFYYTSAVACGFLLAAVVVGICVLVEKACEPPLMPHACDGEGP